MTPETKLPPGEYDAALVAFVDFGDDRNVALVWEYAAGDRTELVWVKTNLRTLPLKKMVYGMDGVEVDSSDATPDQYDVREWVGRACSISDDPVWGLKTKAAARPFTPSVVPFVFDVQRPDCRWPFWLPVADPRNG